MAYYTHPFIKAEHLEEAVDSMVIYDCDSVISVETDMRFHWKRGEFGLTPVSYPRGLLNDQKWTIYVERGGIYALKSKNLETDSFLGKSISYTELTDRHALRIDSKFNHWIAEQALMSGLQD